MTNENVIEEIMEPAAEVAMEVVENGGMSTLAKVGLTVGATAVVVGATMFIYKKVKARKAKKNNEAEEVEEVEVIDFETEEVEEETK